MVLPKASYIAIAVALFMVMSASFAMIIDSSSNGKSEKISPEDMLTMKWNEKSAKFTDKTCSNCNKCRRDFQKLYRKQKKQQPYVKYMSCDAICDLCDASKTKAIQEDFLIIPDVEYSAYLSLPFNSEESRVDLSATLERPNLHFGSVDIPDMSVDIDEVSISTGAYYVSRELDIIGYIKDETSRTAVTEKYQSYTKMFAEDGVDFPFFAETVDSVLPVFENIDLNIDGVSNRNFKDHKESVRSYIFMNGYVKEDTVVVVRYGNGIGCDDDIVFDDGDWIAFVNYDAVSTLTFDETALGMAIDDSTPTLAFEWQPILEPANSGCLDYVDGSRELMFDPNRLPVWIG